MENFNQQEIKDFFEIEKKKHLDFFLPFYQEKNWLVMEDNINGDKPTDWDVKLEIFAGEYRLIDEKVRQSDYNDFLVEIIQDMKTGKLGWLFGQKDWILYGIWIDLIEIRPKNLYLISVNRLKAYILGLEGFIKTCISKKGWGDTWNLVLYWDELLKKEIARKLI